MVIRVYHHVSMEGSGRFGKETHAKWPPIHWCGTCSDGDGEHVTWGWGMERGLLGFQGLISWGRRTNMKGWGGQVQKCYLRLVADQRDGAGGWVAMIWSVWGQTKKQHRASGKCHMTLPNHGTSSACSGYGSLCCPECSMVHISPCPP